MSVHVEWMTSRVTVALDKPCTYMPDGQTGGGADWLLSIGDDDIAVITGSLDDLCTFRDNIGLAIARARVATPAATYRGCGMADRYLFGCTDETCYGHDHGGQESSWPNPT